MRTWITLTLAVALMTAVGCDRGGDANDGGNGEAGATTMKDMADKAKGMASQMSEEMNVQYKMMKQQVEAMKTQAVNNEQVQAMVANIQDKLDAAGEKMDQVKQASGEAAEKAKAELQSLMTELEQMINKAKEQVEGAA